MKSPSARFSLDGGALAIAVVGLLFVIRAQADADATQLCGAEGGVAVQVLGSGGPELSGGRASSAYLVWFEGRARLMVDAGGGSFMRFGQSGARLDDLWHLALTHVHADHSADLVPLVKAGFFSTRTAALDISGPSGRGPFAPLDVFLQRLFGEHGAYAYLGGALDASGGQFLLRPTVVDVTNEAPQRVLSTATLNLDAVGVHHGPVPALGYRADIGARSIAFSGDQDARAPAFRALIQGVDVFIAHLAIVDDSDAVASSLHATPERLAILAREAEVKHLVLSHLMRRSLAAIDTAVETIRAHYSGRLSIARDLDCFNVP